MTRNKGKKETCPAGEVSYMQTHNKGWKIRTNSIATGHDRRMWVR
jgi:hypothetical protein